MKNRDNILSFSDANRVGRRALLNEEEKRTIEGCRQVAAWMLPQLLEGMFEKLDDTLFELSNQKDSDGLQLACFEAMRVIRREREHIESNCQSRVLQIFDGFWQLGDVSLAKGMEAGEDYENLSLVEDDVLEETLAIANMIAKTENRYYREIYALEQRFGSLAHGKHVDQNSNPLSPAIICDAFRRALSNLEIELPVKLVIYKMFDREVMAYLGGMYDGINDVLARAGILPKLTPRVKKNPVSPAVGRSQGTAGEGVSAGMVSDAGGRGVVSGDSDQALFKTIEELLNQRRGAVLAPGTMVTKLPVVETDRLVSALSNLQQLGVAAFHSNNYSESKEIPPAELRTYLVKELKIGQGASATGSLSRDDELVIDVISMLFDFILEDHNLPDAMRALLGRLQIPMVKVALIDANFFRQRLHPARCLLNNLAQAALGWSDDGDRSERSLYGKIESIVGRVLSGFENDVEFFEELNKELDEFLEMERRSSKVAEERAAQVVRGKEQLEYSRQQVEGEIASRVQSYGATPRVVLELVEDGWKNVLLLIALRKGSESQEMEAALTLLDHLLWSVVPKRDHEERHKLLQMIPGLLKGLRRHLTDISYDQHKMIRLFKELQSCHMACLRGKSIADRVVPAAPKPQERQKSVQKESAGNTTKSPLSSEAVSEEDPFLEQASSLPLGSWLEITQGAEAGKRMKLAWKGIVSGAHLFVNNKGMKMMEMEVAVVADALRDGRMIILEEAEKPLMDRALLSIANYLKNGDVADGANPA